MVTEKIHIKQAAISPEIFRMRCFFVIFFRGSVFARKMLALQIWVYIIFTVVVIHQIYDADFHSMCSFPSDFLRTLLPRDSRELTVPAGIPIHSDISVVFCK